MRVIAEELDTFRFASTAPFYVQKGEEVRISAVSAQFFVDWLEQWPDRVLEEDPIKRSVAMRYQRKAMTYWQEKLKQANTE
ncbi:MAG: hypothetical protein GY762_07020 [Proteobacteria bacterium]|nr:hypothetical protein [Pseudomonadota bacterium]MCP4700749.1 hypothetical protein [Gammaproteobacteria bacterium]